MISNDRFLRALKGESMERPPVWMMRQAGRYLPEFMELKNKYDFFTRVQTPELAAEITLQPIRKFPLDAAIIFSDILVIPQALGQKVEMKPGIGPFIEHPIRTQKDVDALDDKAVEDKLHYIFEALALTKKELNGSIPLIGFAGAPWTIFCYMVQGQGSKNFDIAKQMCFEQPKVAHQLLEKITKITIEYLENKVKFGADVIQLFDSWGGLLSPQDYQEFSWKYQQPIIDKIKEKVPVIVFAKGCWFHLETMTGSGASALGIDWTVSPETARKLTNNHITLQGNFDPTWLLGTPESIAKKTHQMIKSFGTNQYIANLGHGILPNVPVENAQTFIESVVNFSS